MNRDPQDYIAKKVKLMKRGVKEIHSKYGHLKKLHTQTIGAFRHTHEKVEKLERKYASLQTKYSKLSEAYEKAKAASENR